GDVERQRRAAPADRLDPGDDVARLVGVGAVGEDDVEAGLGEGKGRLAAEAAVGAGDECGGHGRHGRAARVPGEETAGPGDRRSLAAVARGPAYWWRGPRAARRLPPPPARGAAARGRRPGARRAPADRRPAPRGGRPAGEHVDRLLHAPGAAARTAAVAAD